MVKVIWIAHETRSRDIIPLLKQLHHDGHETHLHYTDLCTLDIPFHHINDHMNSILVIQHTEDFSYADNVWSWSYNGDYMSLSSSQIASFIRPNTDIILLHLKHTTEVPSELIDSGVYIETSFNAVFDRIKSLHKSDCIPSQIAPVLPLAKRLVFIRHAQRLDEVCKEWSDLAERPQDSPLSELGIEQSMHLGNWLAGQEWRDEVAGFFVSPFVRTVHTAHFAIAQDTSRMPQLKVEYGLAEGAMWMAQNKVCRTPWHLNAADLMCVSHRIDLKYQSVKSPQFAPGESYPGRPIEKDDWYNRCAETIWRIVRQPQHDGKTLVLVTHGGCVNYLVHALSGRHLPMVGHTAVTSLLCDEHHAKYNIECRDDGGEMFVSQEHLPHHMRTGCS